MTKKFFISLALCLSLLGTVNPALAQADQKSGADTLAQLQREGWKIVSDGLLQRELIPGEVESFAFGVPGFTWKVKDLQKQLQKLQAEFRANPTPELRKAIANHRKVIVNARRALALARAAEARGEEADLSKVSCAINFSYDATAAKKTDVRGVVANASATFSANCGFTGQVYAYAFASVYVNGAPSTETVTDGPRSGANVSATAFASRNGGTPCESYGYGEMVSSGLNPSSWSKSATNTLCPIPPNPPTATISGTPASSSASPIQLYVYDCVTITWTVNISGGNAPYTTTMYRNGVSLGARTSYSQSVCNSRINTLQTINITATVTDSNGQTASPNPAYTSYIQHHFYRDIETCGSNGQICQ